MKHELVGPEVNANGRQYNEAARRKVAKGARGKFVYDRMDRVLQVAHIVGEVGESILGDDGRVMVEVEPLTEIGKMLVRELDAGRARLFMRGHGRPEKVVGVYVVGEDYEFEAAGIERVSPESVEQADGLPCRRVVLMEKQKTGELSAAEEDELFRLLGGK